MKCSAENNRNKHNKQRRKTTQMKKTQILSVILSVTLLAVGAFAQSPPASSGGGSSGGTGTIVVPADKMPTALAFLGSKAALRAFARESARSANLNINSAGMQGTWGTGSSWDSPKSQEQILSIINAWRFTFTMENPADSVQATTEIKNSDWETLFSAESWRTPQLVSGSSYRLPELYFHLTLADIIPFKVDRSVQWGQIKYLNDDGRTITTVDLVVRNGKVYFRSDLAGKGILVLHNNDGRTFLYNLRNGGVQVPVASVQYMGSSSWIENMPWFNNPSTINQQVWSWNGVGQNPTFDVNMDSSAWVSFRTYSNEGAEAIGFQVRPQGGTNWTFYPVVLPAKYVPIQLTPGTSFIIPVWNPDEFKEPEPYIPENGTPVGFFDGKG